jgi:uncharacterized protein
MISLTDAQYTLVASILRTFVPDYPVWVFGSRLTATHKPFSDLDLCLWGEEPLDFSQLVALEEAFSESSLPFKVDVVDWHRLETSFREMIASHWVAFPLVR